MTERQEPAEPSQARIQARGVERIFLGWERPLLVSAARWLLGAGNESEGLVDLSSLAVVVPGRRAARRLLERLVDENRRRGPGLIPPRILTLGLLPEQLYRPRIAIAGDLEERLVRLAALRAAPAELVAQLFPAGVGGDDGLEAALELERLDEELAAEGRDLADVRAAGAELDLFADERRWQALEELRGAFERRLSSLGRQSRTRARFRALGGDLRGTLDSPWERVVLVGLIDLPRLFRGMLRRSGAAITALLQAPEEIAETLDEWGCPRLGSWQERALDLDEPRGSAEIAMTLRPADQIRRTVVAVRQWCEEDGYAAEEIAVGFGDPSLSRPLLEALELVDLEAHSPYGRALESASPVRALRGLSRFLASRRLQDLASALRVPVVEDWVRRQIELEVEESGDPELGEEDDWLAALDRHLSERYQSESAPFPLEEGDREHLLVARLVAAIDSLFEGDEGPARRSLAEWPRVIAIALERLYPEPLDPGLSDQAEEIEALERLADVLREANDLPASVAAEEIELAQALRLLLWSLAAETLPAGAAGRGVELLGWLELALDDAPATVVVGLNEGTLPARVLGDPFLPDSLRGALGLVESHRRYARDLFLLSGLLHSRERLLLVCGRQSAEGEPLAPSRLLLARKPEELAGAVLALYGPSLSDEGGREVPWEHGERSVLRLPRPQPLERPIVSLRATAFRDYLACPYRFYLRHVLGLQAVEGRARELDARAFGVLTHEVLRRFALGSLAASEDAEAIARQLRRVLRELAAERLGERTLPAVRVQLAQLARRFEVFARWQAQQASSGWRIDPELVERRLEMTLEVDGRAFLVSGAIDRVDTHPQRGRRVIDYKTGDTPRSPEETHGPHRETGEWRDLQLPLYRRLVSELVGGEDQRPVEVAYVCLSKRLSADPYRPAKWQPADLRGALEAAAWVVRALRAERFWPPSAPPPYDDGLGRLCGDRLPERLRLGPEDGRAEDDSLLENGTGEGRPERGVAGAAARQEVGER